ncbi:MAG TPA: methylamine utilization protein [Gammaproteobacteria bacterium]
MKFPAASWPCLCLAGLCLLAGPALAARDVGVRVLDQDGTPLQDAVITLRPAHGTASTAAATAAGHAGSAVAVMDQRGRIFVPHVLVVRPGTRVEFPNSDHVRHHVYSFSPPKPFELKLYANTEIPAVTFDRPGVVSLGCNIHDWMQGYVYVTDDPLFTLSAADGVGRFSGLAGGGYRMHIWHPRLRGPYLGETFDLELDAATPAQLDYRVTVRSRPAQQPAQQPPGADLDPAYGQRF